ncbi:MAG: BMP family ABC transporter substrate-binding protein [Eubacteriales bacterium]
MTKKTSVTLIIILILIISAICCGALVSCSGNDENYTIALITGASGVTNRSAAQGTYAGIVSYCSGKNITYKYFVPEEDTETSYSEAAEKALEDGAKLIVFAGYNLSAAAKAAAENNKDRDFLLVDCYGDYEDINCFSVSFREEQAGFLAGYAAVTEGHTKLGFVSSGENEITKKYLYGFIAGAEYAAVLYSVPQGEIKCWYTENSEDDRIKRLVMDWYGEGVQSIMICGEGIAKPVISAANIMKGRTIGCDMDQAGNSERYLTSAVKNYESVVMTLLESYFRLNKWDDTKEGKNVVFGIETDSVGLPTGAGSFRFSAWSTDSYETVYARLKSGKIPSPSPDSPPITAVFQVVVITDVPVNGEQSE